MDPLQALMQFIGQLFSAPGGEQSVDTFGGGLDAFSPNEGPTPVPLPEKRPQNITPPARPRTPSVPLPEQNPNFHTLPEEQNFMPIPTPNMLFHPTQTQQSLTDLFSFGQLMGMMYDPARTQQVTDTLEGKRYEGKGRNKQPVETVYATKVR